MDNALRPLIKDMIVKSLRLPIPSNEIIDEAPLFGEGLGLDSIDALEIVLAIERSFGITIGDEQTAKRVLQSVDAIADYIEEQRGTARGNVSVAQQ